MTADTPRDAATPPLPPIFQPLLPEDPREVGGYRLFARLGAGGMGRVYLSYTPGGRPVALKVVRPEFAEDSEFRRRFAQEVTNAQRIHGLYTAQVIDSGVEADAPWLVTAYVPGPSLQQVIREHGALPVRTVLLLMGGIAEALQAIHSVEVVHRDLKPANVLVAGDGPRVIDFGIARAADATALTGTGFRIGSPAFMSPEQAQGRPVTPATDVFALGALAAYVAGGAPPFGEGPETAVLYRVVHEPPVLDGVPADLRELLLRCLAKSPEDRPKPAEIIEAARNHPSVGGQLRFADDWLPQQINTEITRRSDLPKTPPTPLPVPPAAPPAFGPPPIGSSGAPQPAYEAPTGPVIPSPPTVQLHQQPSFDTPPPGPVVTDTMAAPAPEPKRRGVSWKVLLTVALVMAVGGTAGGVVLVKQMDKGGSTGAGGSPSAAADSPQAAPSKVPSTTPSPSASSEPAESPSPSRSTASKSPSATATSRPAVFTAVYQDRELGTPDYNYSYDLAEGKIVNSSASTAWELETGYSNFDWNGADAYITTEAQLTPEQCSAAIDRQPAGALKYDALPPGRLFCLRHRASGSIVIAKVLTQGNSNGMTKLSVTYYRNDA